VTNGIVRRARPASAQAGRGAQIDVDAAFSSTLSNMKSCFGL
jgi:hypothetical protein